MSFNPLSLTKTLKKKKKAGGRGNKTLLKGSSPNLLQAIQCDIEALTDSKAKF